MKRTLLLVVLGAVFAGCVSESRGIARDEEIRWEVGKTTKRDVVAAWGNPDYVAGDTWVWWGSHALGGKFKVQFMHLGVSLSNSRRSTRDVRLQFDRDGRLASLETVESVPGDVNWSSNPF